MKLVFFLFYLLSFSFCATAQDSIRIQGQLLHNTKFPKVVVKKFGLGAADIAVIEVNKETGIFNIVAPAYAEPGIYRLQYSQSIATGFVDLIINGKENEIQFTLDVEESLKGQLPVFSKSKENSAWYTFEKLRVEKINQLLVLDAFLASYPSKEDAFYKKAVVERANKVKAYLDFRTQFIQTTPYYYAKQLAKYTNTFFPDPTSFWRLNEFESHDNFWNEKTTTDTLLLNTPLYTDAILNYISIYLNPAIEFSVTEQNEGFKKCVDKLILLFSGNKETKQFAINYLQLGFKEIGNEEVLQYIDQKYAVNEQCNNDDAELQKRMQGYETLKIGKLAPTIELTSNDGSIKTLNDYTHEHIVVIFWASWCPHCMKELPKLQIWAKEHPENQILAISLDDDYTAFKKAIFDLPDMLHYCDLQKWNGDIVKSYNVLATPTLFYLDKNRKIINKFSSIQSFLNSIK